MGVRDLSSKLKIDDGGGIVLGFRVLLGQLIL
jgi:hypothetical protein